MVYFPKCETGSDFYCDQLWIIPKVIVGEKNPVFSKIIFTFRLLFGNDLINKKEMFMPLIM